MPEPEGSPPDDRGADEYIQRVEDRFAQLRGTPLLLSPKDWALAECWWRDGIPLRIVLEAMESVFEARAAAGGGAPRPVLSLAYCRHEVEAAFEEWRESRLGAGTGSALGQPSRPGPEEAARFLCDCARRLETASSGRPHAAPLEVAARKLQELAVRLRGPSAPALAVAEEELEAVEDELLDGLLAAMDPATREAMEEAIREDVGALRPRLTERAYRSNVQGRLRSQIREREGLPRLTLYLL